MPDSNSPIGGTFEDLQEETNEAVVQPIADEVGKAIEAGVQSVIASPLTPQQLQQKKMEEQEQLVEARRKIAFWQDLEMRQKQVREEEKQKQAMKQQMQQQEKQEEAQEEQAKAVSQKSLHPDIAAKGKAEIKRGVGG